MSPIRLRSRGDGRPRRSHDEGSALTTSPLEFDSYQEWEAWVEAHWYEEGTTIPPTSEDFTVLQWSYDEDGEPVRQHRIPAPDTPTIYPPLDRWYDERLGSRVKIPKPEPPKVKPPKVKRPPGRPAALSRGDVLSARILLDAGVSVREVARIFGVTSPTITAVKRRTGAYADVMT